MMNRLKGFIACVAATVTLLVISCLGGYVKADYVNIVPDDVFNIELPTLRERNDTTFDFIMDPQGLIAATDAARYGGVEFEEGQTVYFQNSDMKYSNSSRSLSIKNYSTMDVKVMVTATLQDCEELRMSEDRYFRAGAQDAMFYLALVDSEGQELAINDSYTAVLTTTLKAADDAYEIVCNDGVYEYVLKENYEESSIYEYSFWITGACNGNADWEGLDWICPSVLVEWTVTACTEIDAEQALEAADIKAASGSAINIE